MKTPWPAVSSLNEFLKQTKLRFLIKKFERQIARINSIGEAGGARICFFDLFPAHYQFSRSLIKNLAKTHPVVLLVFDKNHPARTEKGLHDNIHVFLVDDRWRPFVLQWLRIPYLVTPASHLHPSAVRSDMKIVHSYHSLVSMHAVYGDDAFDSYTHFFACGQHHVEEIRAIKAARGLPPATIYEVGYPKLDDLAETYASKQKTNSCNKTIVLAPSWHPDNLLTLHGEAICQSILTLGHNLIVRPHPHLYDRDVATMDVLRSASARSGGRMVIENPNEAFESFWRADLMISDWSGVALEYAFATERPVVFIDAPRKANSVDLLNIELPTIEDILRIRIGVKVEGAERVGDGINAALELSPDEWARRIADVREEYIFNYGNGAKSGSEILSGLADDAEMLPPTDISRERLEELIAYYA